MKLWCRVFVIVTAACAGPITSAMAQLRATEDDVAYLHRALGLKPDDETLCRLNKAEAARLHQLVRAADAADVKAYLANVYLDQLFDEQHHIPRPNACR